MRRRQRFLTTTLHECAGTYAGDFHPMHRDNSILYYLKLLRTLPHLARRAELKAVTERQDKPSGESLHKFWPRLPKSAKSLDQYISYQTLPSPRKHGKNAKVMPHREIIGHCENGPDIAPALRVRNTKPQGTLADSDEPAHLISNAGVIEIPDERDLPNEYEFEILRLRRRAQELECTVRDKDERIVRAIGMLEDELQMYRTYLHERVGETHGGIMRRVLRLEATLNFLKDPNARVYPDLSVRDSWKKGKV